MPVPIYLISFNRLTWLRQLAEQCQKFPDSTVVIVDNASTYPPLVDWLHNCPYETVRLPANIGHQSPWRGDVIRPLAEHEKRWGTPHYVVSDHDLSVETVPSDALAVLQDGLTRWPQTGKVGLSLAIDDVHPAWAAKVQAWESQFWTTPQHGMYFQAAIDTTFAMYHARTPGTTAQEVQRGALRTAPPYMAKHLPWYLDAAAIDDEHRYYWRMCNNSANWMPQGYSERGHVPHYHVALENHAP